MSQDVGAGAGHRGDDGGPGGLRIRLGAPSDLPAIAQMVRTSAEVAAGGPVEDPGFDGLLIEWWADEQSRRVLLVAEEGERAVGMATLTLFIPMPRPGPEPPASWCLLADVHVVPGQDAGDVGGRLVDTAVAVARDWGCVQVVLAPTGPSLPSSEQAGFAPATMLLARTLR